MIRMVRLLVNQTHCCGVHKNEKIISPLGLGCKRSLVQIQLRRPILLSYLFEITRHLNQLYLCTSLHISAHYCGKKILKAGSFGTIIGKPIFPNLEPLLGPLKSLYQTFKFLSDKFSNNTNRARFKTYAWVLKLGVNSKRFLDEVWLRPTLAAHATALIRVDKPRPYFFQH